MNEASQFVAPVTIARLRAAEGYLLLAVLGPAEQPHGLALASQSGAIS